MPESGLQNTHIFVFYAVNIIPCLILSIVPQNFLRVSSLTSVLQSYDCSLICTQPLIRHYFETLHYTTKKRGWTKSP